MSDREFFDGFTVCYGSDRGDFRFFVSALIGSVSVIVLVVAGQPLALAVALLFLGSAYYHFPLVEKKVPRLGASQYGIFVDGFGIIDWRAVADIEIRTYAVRSIENKELVIELNRDVDAALISDWRKLPIYRLLMKLPWRLRDERVLSVQLEPFSINKDKLLETLQRMRSFYRN